MISRGEDVEAEALRKRGWSISAIARHLGRDRETIRDYLNGKREPGVRRSPVPDPLEPYKDYLTARLADNAHIWASALFDEVVPLGYSGAYVSFARQLRHAKLRPHCEACAGVGGREYTEIEHAPGDETQWDWFERRHAPWGETAYVLLGSLSASGRTRGVLAASMDQPHLIEAIDGVLRRLGGTTASGAPIAWRRSSCRAPGRSRRPSPRLPSTTGPSLSPARPGGATARVWWSRLCASHAGGGGER